MVEGLQVTTDKAAAAEQIKGLYKLFTEKDCTMVEASRSRARSLAASSCGLILRA